jgi:hypothetical protein
MALVLLPGLTNLIDDISEEKKLAPQVVEAALREALLKGYERYRRTLYIGISEDPFDEDYFSNFDVGLDLEEEGYRVLASKIIVDEVESEDHQIALAEVMQVAEDAQSGDTGRARRHAREGRFRPYGCGHNQTSSGPKAAGSAAPNDPRGICRSRRSRSSPLG